MRRRSSRFDVPVPGAGAFAPVTSVRERDGVLWIGSLEGDGIGRLAAPQPHPVAERR